MFNFHARASRPRRINAQLRLFVFFCCLDNVSLMHRNKDDSIYFSMNFALRVLQDSWLGCIATFAETLDEDQFVFVRDIGIGKLEGLLYINNQLQNIPPSAIIPENELERIFDSSAMTFPATLEQFKLKYPYSVIIAFYN